MEVSLDKNATLPNNSSSSPTNSISQPATITTVLFSFVIATGFPGNLLVVSAIFNRQQLRTPCYSLILSIAIADLGIALFAAPQRIIENYIGWPFGKFLCNFLVSIQELFVSVSVLTHTAIALERYRVIVQPFKNRMRLKTAKLIAAAIWLSCYITAALPQALMLELQYYKPADKLYCAPVFPSLTVRRVYEIYLVVVFIALPLFIQSWCYVNVFIVARSELHFSKGCEERRDFIERTRKKIRLVKVVVFLVAVFQFCSIPRGVLMLITEFKADAALVNNSYYWYADIISLFAYYIKHVINPVILWCTNTEFRFCCR